MKLFTIGLMIAATIADTTPKVGVNEEGKCDPNGDKPDIHGCK